MTDPALEALLAELRQVVDDDRVLSAIASLPRERFVPDDQRINAYANVALPIGAGQTISQPLVVARMLALVDPQAGERVLDVGTGSGYHAALLASLAGHVWTIERHAELSARARAVTQALGIENVTFVVGDGGDGLPSEAPFSVINVAASAETTPAALERQLAPGGRLVIPVGGEQQHLVLVRNTEQGLEREQYEQVRFVPLIYDSGHDSPHGPPRLGEGASRLQPPG